MSKLLRGVIRGKTIELADDPGIEDGRGVEVIIQTMFEADSRVEAILRTAGSMADDPEFSRFVDEVERHRQTT